MVSRLLFNVVMRNAPDRRTYIISLHNKYIHVGMQPSYYNMRNIETDIVGIIIIIVFMGQKNDIKYIMCVRLLNSTGFKHI